MTRKQYIRGWCMIAATPPVIALPLLLFGDWQLVLASTGIGAWMATAVLILHRIGKP